MIVNPKLKIGDKVVLAVNVITSSGTLYKDSKVKVDEIGFPDRDLRVVDDVGKIWYINYSDILT